MTKTLQQMIESWFLSWLMGHRGLSPQSVSSYRDSFRLLMRWLNEARGISADKATFEDIGRDDVISFMRWLGTERGCCPKTVNCRLGAIRSFADYVACECPERSAWAASIRGIKPSKEAKPALDFLTPDEISCLIEACDRSTASGRRDALTLKLLFNTGFRVSELISLRVDSFIFGEGRCHVTVIGKGRKVRTVPIWDDTRYEVERYISENELSDKDYLFPGRNIEHISRSGMRSRIDKITARAKEENLALGAKSISPHTFRHSTAMAMLAAGVDLSTIAIWLGHESVQTTHKYMVADMEMKERALEKALGQNPFGKAPGKITFKPDEKLLAFLDSL